MRVLVLPENRHGATDQRTIGCVVGPLPAVFEAFGNRRPRRERIITEMIVEFDQTGENRATTFNDCNGGEACRRWLRAILNCEDAAVLDIHDGIGYYRERVIHSDHAPRERELWAREWIDRALLLGRRDQPAPATGDSPCQRKPIALAGHGMIPFGTFMVMF